MNTYLFKTIFFLVVTSIIIIIFQHTLFSLQFFNSIKPEFFTLLVLNYSFYEAEKTRGYLLASFVGFIEDIFTNQIFGLNIFFKSLLFLFIYSLKNKIYIKSLFLKSFLGILINISEIYAIYILSNIFQFSYTNSLTENFINYLILNIIVTPIFIFFIDSIQSKYINNFNENKN